jgi:Mrp family chromosome partitioning ATPase
MSIATSTSGTSLSVGFEPIIEAQESLFHLTEFANIPVVSRILEKMGQALLELGRRARRVGSVKSGTIVLLAGCHEGSGCTTAALSMAAAASSECPTALVDVDLSNFEFRNPKSERKHSSPGDLDSFTPTRNRRSLTQILVGEPSIGWDDVVGGAASYDDALHHIDSREALAFFPKSVRSEGGFPTSNLELSHARLAGFFGRLRDTFGLVFLDAGTVDTGALHFAPWADATLIVCSPRRANDSDWTKAWDRFEERGTHVLGIVESSM